jgi:hypothetical protein
MEKKKKTTRISTSTNKMYLLSIYYSKFECSDSWIGYESMWHLEVVLQFN